MKTNEEIKEMVRDTYGKIASMPVAPGSCCGTHSGDLETVFSEDYSKMEGYAPEADLGLGCGIPVQSSRIKKGDTVVDLGSGAGNDAFVAQRLTGPEGRVIGIDMTPAMITKARKNAEILGHKNVEFRLGEIENTPVDAGSADVVLSNCVLNLVPDKAAAFQEIFRILKDGGHFSISDIVLSGDLPSQLLDAAALYAGCVSGALKKDEYLSLIKEAGFRNIAIQKEKSIFITDDILSTHLSVDEIKAFRASGLEILSITVSGEKNPGSLEVLQSSKTKDDTACSGSGCCC